MPADATLYDILRVSDSETLSDVLNAVAYLDVQPHVVEKSEDDVHAVYYRYVETTLELFLPLGITKMARSHKEPRENIQPTIANSRPDLTCSVKNVLIFRGEEKKHGVQLPVEELVTKMVNWNPATLDQLPYIFGYAASGAKFQLVVLYPCSGDTSSVNVQIKRIGRVLDLLRVNDCLTLIRYMINLACIVARLVDEISDDVPSIGVPFENDSARSSVLIINNDQVHKMLKPGHVHKYRWDGIGGLQGL